MVTPHNTNRLLQSLRELLNCPGTTAHYLLLLLKCSNANGGNGLLFSKPTVFWS